MFYKSRKNRLRSPMGTQSILLFEEKTFWYLQGNTLFRIPVRKTTPFPSITAEKQTLRSKKLEESSYKHAFYTVPTRISEPKIFRTSYSADTNVLEQENAWERWPKMGLQAKERRAKITILPCSFRVSRLFYPLFGDIWVMGPQKICKTRFRTVKDRLSWW